MGRKALFCAFRTNIQYELVDAQALNLEKLPDYRQLFEKARQAERTLEHRAEIDHRSREADRHSHTRRSTAPVMAMFPEVSAPVFATTGSPTPAIRTQRTRLGTPAVGPGRSAASMPVHVGWLAGGYGFSAALQPGTLVPGNGTRVLVRGHRQPSCVFNYADVHSDGRAPCHRGGPSHGAASIV